jgi:hypothetical protein
MKLKEIEYDRADWNKLPWNDVFVDAIMKVLGP